MIHRNKRFSLRLRELLLLLIRTGIILFLVLGLSGIQCERRGRVTEEDLSRQYVPNQILLMDTSYSMGYLDGGTTRLQHATEGARTILDGARPGQRFLVLPFSDGIDEPMLERAEWTHDTQVCAEELEALAPTGVDTNAAKALKQISSFLVDPVRVRVMLFSDLQRNGWLELIETFRGDPGFAKSLPDVLVFPVGTEDVKNFWLESTRASLPAFFAKGEGLALPLLARANGYGEDQSLPMQMHLQGRLVPADGKSIPCVAYERRLRVQGNDTQQLDVPLVPLGAGIQPSQDDLEDGTVFLSWVGESRLEMESDVEEQDRLPFDNTVRWTIPVLWSMRVGLVLTKQETVASRVLEVALSPTEKATDFFAKPRKINVSELGIEELSKIPSMVLQEDAWSELSSQGQENLLRYVREGGNLIAFVTEQESFGLVQACSASAEVVRSASGPMTLCGFQWRHRALMPLERFGIDSAENVFLYQAVRFGGLDQTWFQCLVSERLPNSVPSLAGPFDVFGEKAYGKGRIVFCGVGLEGERSDLASSVIFLPILHQTLKYLVEANVPKIGNDSTLLGERRESVVDPLTLEQRRQLVEQTGLLIPGEGLPLVARRRTDLTSLLLTLVVGLALMELWVGNRRI